MENRNYEKNKVNSENYNKLGQSTIIRRLIFFNKKGLETLRVVTAYYFGKRGKVRTRAWEETSIVKA